MMAVALITLGALLCVFVLFDMGGDTVPNPAMGAPTVVKR